MNKHVPQIFSGEQCNSLEEDWLVPDPWPPSTFECYFCGRDFESDQIRDFTKDVDGSMDMVCIKCVRHGMLDNFIKRGT